MSPSGQQGAEGAEHVAPEHATIVPDTEGSAPAGRSVSNPLLALQAVAGNRAVNALLAEAQTKLDVGPAGDAFEVEADLVAGQVGRLLGGADGQGDDGGADDPAGRDTPGRIRRRAPVGAAGGDVDPDTEARVARARRGGQRLADDTRQAMEGAIGADFSAVRVHVGQEAAALNDRLGAKAFTLGSDIFFRDRAPDAGTTSGRELLAHELTHTVQQGAAPTVRRLFGFGKKKPKEAPSEEAPLMDGKGELSDEDKALMSAVSPLLAGRVEPEPKEVRRLMKQLADRELLKGTPEGAAKKIEAEWKRKKKADAKKETEKTLTEGDAVRSAAAAGRTATGGDVVAEGAKPAGVLGVSTGVGQGVNAGIGDSILGVALLADAAMGWWAGHGLKEAARKQGDAGGVQMGENQERAGKIGVGMGAVGVTKAGVDTGTAFSAAAKGAGAATFGAAAGGLGIAGGALMALQGLWRGGKAAEKLWELGKVKLMSTKGEAWSARIKDRQKWKIAVNALKVAAGALGIAAGVIFLANPITGPIAIAAAVVAGAIAGGKLINKIVMAYQRKKATQKIHGKEAEELDRELSKLAVDKKAAEAPAEGAAAKGAPPAGAKANTQLAGMFAKMTDAKLLEVRSEVEADAKLPVGRRTVKPEKAQALMRELSLRDAKKAKPKAAGPGPSGAVTVTENRINPLDPHAAERKRIKAQGDAIAQEFSVNARVAGEMRGALGSGAVPTVVDKLGGKAVSPTDVDYQAYDAWLLLGALNISAMQALSASGQDLIEKKMSVAENA